MGVDRAEKFDRLFLSARKSTISFDLWVGRTMAVNAAAGKHDVAAGGWKLSGIILQSLAATSSGWAVDPSAKEHYR